MISIWLFLAGIAGGLIAGLLGVGGGIVFLAILPFTLVEFGILETDLVQHIVANSLFGVFFASLSGNIAHITTRSFYLRESILVGIAGSLAAILVLNFIVIQSWYTRWIFNVIIILFLLYILITQFLNPDQTGKHRHNKRKNSFQLATAGIAGGILSAASGTGGGAVTVPLLNRLLGMDIKKAKSISLSMILLSSMIMTLINLFVLDVEKYSDWQQGLIIFPIAIPLTIGVIISAPLGVHLSHKVSSRTLNTIFAVLLFVIIIEKLVELYLLQS